MRLSVLMPTRGRPQLVRRFLDSLVATAKRPGEIETVLYVDEDDPRSHSIDHPEAVVRAIIGPHITLGATYAECYARSEGEVLMLAGDDFVFRTPGWDDLVLAPFEEHSDGIALVYGNDLNQGENVCTAAFFSRVLCELLGGPCPEEYTGEYIDAHLLDVFRRLEQSGYSRIHYMPEVIIEHMHHVVGKAPFDETYARRTPTHLSKEIFDRLAPLREDQVAALLRFMRRRNPVTGASVGVEDQ